MDGEFSRRLPQEVALWQREHLIQEPQARAILARYGLEGQLDDRRSRAVSLLVGLGVLLLGIGIITFVAANWQALSAVTKLLILVAAVLAANAAGYWLRYERESYPRVGSALILLAAMLFGAAIFLIAQVFHVRAHEPYLLYLWALGVLPGAYLLAMAPMLALAIFALAAGLAWDLAEFSPGWHGGVGAYLAFGLFLYSVGEAHRDSGRLRELARPYTGFGSFIVFLVLYILSFRFLWSAGGAQSAGAHLDLSSAFGVRLIAMSGIATAAVVLRWVRLRPALRAPETWEGAAVLALLVIPWVLTLAGPGLQSPEHVFYPPAAIVFNLVLFALTLALIWLGLIQHRPEFVNTGVWFFGLHLMTRYFDIFGRLLHTSLVFIGAGLLLLIGGAMLERTRRRLVQEIRAPAG